MKYTSGEVRARFEAWLIREHEYAPEDLIWQEKRNCYADYATHLAWNAYRDAYADLLERIKADESTMPAATACADHAKGETGYCIFHTQVSWGTKLFAHPPAQAAQSVDVAKVREVIAHLRSFRSNTPPTWAHLDDAADKLEAALQEKSS